MADNTHFYGFRWVRSLTGSAQPKVLRYRIASGYQPTAGGTNVDLHAGDPVQQVNDGTISMAVGSEGTQSTILGIVAGFSPQYDGTRMSPASKYTGATTYGSNLERQGFAYVILAADQMFEVDADENSTATTEAAYNAFIGENADMVLTADTTNANDPKADPMLDISTHATTNTLQWRILDTNQIPGIDYSGKYVKLRVTVNKTAQAPFQTTGV